MSRLPQKMVRIAGIRLSMLDAACLLALADFPVTPGWPLDKRCIQKAQRLLARWLTPSVYFRLHCYRPRQDDVYDAIKRLRGLGFVDVAGQVTAEGQGFCRSIRDSMEAALTPWEWTQEGKKEQAASFKRLQTMREREIA